MGWMFSVAGVLLMAFGQYRRAKQQGRWHWGLFLGILGAAGLFIGLVILPLAQSNLINTNPNLLIVLILVAALSFPVGVVLVARKVSKNWVVKN